MTTTTYPQTLGEFVRLGWRMEALCYPCNGCDKRVVEMKAANETYGAEYSTRDFMIRLHCKKCGRKLSLYDIPPEDKKSPEPPLKPRR